MAAASDVVFIASDNLIMVTKVTSKSAGTLISDATVTLLRLVEDADGEDGATVVGSESIDCPAVEGVAGAYYGTLPDTVVAALPEGRSYAAYVQIDAGPGRLKTFRRKLRAVWANA
jgi:hypothetical protein